MTGNLFSQFLCQPGIKLRQDNNPLLGHYRVKMALDALGYRYGHTTVWQTVALYKHAHPSAQRESHSPNPAKRPQQATARFVDVRYLVQKVCGYNTPTNWYELSDTKT